MIEEQKKDFDDELTRDFVTFEKKWKKSIFHFLRYCCAYGIDLDAILKYQYTNIVKIYLSLIDLSSVSIS